MARMESKSLSVNPKDEQNIIDKFQKFGWSLVSSQEIYNKDSHLEGTSNGVKSVTETTNFVKLVFNRDKDMPYYNEICSCEARYDQLMSHEPVKAHKGFILNIIIIFIGAVTVFSGASDIGGGGLFGILIGIAMIALSIFLIKRKIDKNKQSENTYQTEHEKWKNDVAAVLSEIEAYV